MSIGPSRPRWIRQTRQTLPPDGTSASTSNGRELMAARGGATKLLDSSAMSDRQVTGAGKAQFAPGRGNGMVVAIAFIRWPPVRWPGRLTAAGSIDLRTRPAGDDEEEVTGA